MGKNKSTIGVPRKFINLASSYISKCLTFISNQSLQRGVLPDILKIFTDTPIDKGGELTDPPNFQRLHKYFKNLYTSSLSTILRSGKSSFSSIWP